MSYISRYDKGDWIALCDVCGRKYKASTLKKRWDGLMCCDDDWEIRQPQDFVRGVADTQIAPWLRTEPSNGFVPVTTAQPMQVYPVVSTSTLVATFIEGPEKQYAYSTVIATLTYKRSYPVGPGAREINGSPINTNSLG